MIDVVTKNRVTVSTDGTTGPYIIVPVRQLALVSELLDENGIPFTFERDGIRVDGKPVMAIVNLGKDADATAVQTLLDHQR